MLRFCGLFAVGGYLVVMVVCLIVLVIYNEHLLSLCCYLLVWFAFCCLVCIDLLFTVGGCCWLTLLFDLVVWIWLCWAVCSVVCGAWFHSCLLFGLR